MDPDNLLSKCLREVRIGLATKWLPGAVPRGYDASRCEADLNALLQMLAVNCSLELVDVVVPTIVRRRRTHESFSLSPICKLDQLMLSKIFELAVPPILRQVFFPFGTTLEGSWMKLI
ncbi:hypothetical protein JG688_00007455 [Phytophthora aleatoria]|uniref:Uncharacterized protein n=1 Tax=Phytophthora aleatoria TaxID=2496075 RepID=A0A8J5J5Y5_9STRA|nr:hypothetical protein JG688_00007455 [Phytophthora aleatoria]